MAGGLIKYIHIYIFLLVGYEIKKNNKCEIFTNSKWMAY